MDELWSGDYDVLHWVVERFERAGRPHPGGRGALGVRGPARGSTAVATSPRLPWLHWRVR